MRNFLKNIFQIQKIKKIRDSIQKKINEKIKKLSEKIKKLLKASII